MSSIQTKDKILLTATQLFNKYGVATITLRDIADAAKISIGNLAYHYKNKDAIIKEIYQRMEEERKELLSKVQFIPSFENINEQVVAILELSLKYKFFYISTLYITRSFPSIAKLHRAYVESHIAYIKAMLDYSVGVGNLFAEPKVGYYQRLSEVVWSTLHFWLQQEEMRGIKKHDLDTARMVMWELVLPHLTEKGKQKIEPLLKVATKTVLTKNALKK